jgi:two-component system sensor histidine kinase YesM
MQLNKMEDILVEYFDKVDFISEELHQNELIIQTLYKKDIENRNKTYQVLFTSTSELRGMAQFELYSKGGICKYSTSTRTLNTKLPTYWGILRAAGDNPDSLVIRIENDYTNVSNDIVLRSARTIVDNAGNCIGYIVNGMKTEDFDNLLEGTYGTQDSIAILDGQWNTIYSTGPDKEKSIGRMLKEQLINGKDISSINKEHNFYISQLGDTGLYIVLQREEFFTKEISKTMYSISAIMTLLSLILCVGVSLRLSKSLSKPIHTITEAMHRIEEGHLDTRIEIERIDEFGDLATNFNIMVNKLCDYMDYKVKQQQELNDSNIAMMQAQLNPHFIYNTLDTIKWVAKANHIPEIATLVTSLAKILRTGISSSQLITLKEELSIVQSYVDIQRIRFDEKFKYVTEIQNELEMCIVPKLVIQPLVENAIIHGLADRDDGNIHINAFKENDKLIITVSDDGCGISEEVMEFLNSRVRKKLDGGIGIYNIDTIIRLRYGDEFGVFFDKIEKGGTKVTVLLPFILQEVTEYA